MNPAAVPISVPPALILLALAGCAGGGAAPRVAPPPPPLSAAETEFLCAVLPVHVERLGSSGADGAGEEAHRRAAEVIASVRWNQSGGWPECTPGEPLRLTGSRYVDGWGLSADGSVGAISGGWQLAPTAGGWGQCYFERQGGNWRLLGCVLSGVS